MDACLPSRIDILSLAIHTGEGESGIRHMLQRYMESAEDCLDQMEHAADEKNILRWMHALHEMKAASVDITARRLASLCTEADAIREFPHGQTAAMLYHLQKELVILRGEIEHLISATQ